LRERGCQERILVYCPVLLPLNIAPFLSLLIQRNQKTHQTSDVKSTYYMVRHPFFATWRIRPGKLARTIRPIQEDDQTPVALRNTTVQMYIAKSLDHKQILFEEQKNVVAQA
jgi:hypothetical protein